MAQLGGSDNLVTASVLMEQEQHRQPAQESLSHCAIQGHKLTSTALAAKRTCARIGKQSAGYDQMGLDQEKRGNVSPTHITWII